MTASTRSAGSRHGEAGAGLIGTFFGVVVFLVLLLVAVQVLSGLYARSVVAAVSYDAARTLGGADQGDGEASRAVAVARARRQLGSMGEKATFEWDNDPDTVRLTVRSPAPTVLPQSLTGPVGLGDIERTVTVRVERVR